jgi:hypothetical protein
MVHKILPPKIGVCGHHRCFPGGDIGRRQQAFLAPLPWKAQIEVYRQSYKQNQNWYSLAKQANLALFSCLC